MKKIYLLLGKPKLVLSHLNDIHRGRKIDYTYSTNPELFSFIDLVISGELHSKDKEVFIHINYINIDIFEQILDKITYFSSGNLEFCVDILHKEMDVESWQLDIIEMIEDDENSEYTNINFSTIQEKKLNSSNIDELSEIDPIILQLSRVDMYVTIVNKAYGTMDYGYGFEDDYAVIPKKSQEDEENIPPEVQDTVKTLLLNVGHIINEELIHFKQAEK